MNEDPVTITYRVPYADTDQMGIVYYANYLVYFERFRNELLRRTGSSYREWEERGILLPVVKACCRYRAPARYDDILTFSGRVYPFKQTRIRIDYRVLREGALLAEGHTIHACLNRSGRPTRVPEGLLEKSGIQESEARRRGNDPRPGFSAGG